MYILENDRGRFYVGQTGNLAQRVVQYETRDADVPQYTHKHGPGRLVWNEAHPTRAAALARERQIKAIKSARCIPS